MPFAALDDGFHANKKIARAGNEGAGVYARALSYCAAQTTDGYIPRTTALEFVQGKKAILAKLEKVGLWHAVKPGDKVVVTDRSENALEVEIEDHGYVILDYVQFNFSSVEIAARSKQRADAGRKGAIIRWEAEKAATQAKPDSGSHSNRHSGSHGGSHGNDHGEKHGGEHGGTDSKPMAQTRAHARPAPNPLPQNHSSNGRPSLDHPRELPADKQILLGKALLHVRAKDREPNTELVLARLIAALPDSRIAKVIESAATTTANVGNTAGYLVTGLEEELYEYVSTLKIPQSVETVLAPFPHDNPLRLDLARRSSGAPT